MADSVQKAFEEAMKQARYSGPPYKTTPGVAPELLPESGPVGHPALEPPPAPLPKPAQPAKEGREP